MCISDNMQTTFFYLGRFLKKLADDQISSITKGSIYHIKHMSIQPFTMAMYWPEITRLMEVSIIFDILHILCFYFVCKIFWYVHLFVILPISNNIFVMFSFIPGYCWCVDRDGHQLSDEPVRLTAKNELTCEEQLPKPMP